MDRADLGVALLAEIVAGGLDVFRGAAEGNENGIGVVGFELGNKTVVAAGKLTELGVALLEEAEDGFIEIIPAGDHAVHVVLLVLHRPEENRVI